MTLHRFEFLKLCFFSPQSWIFEFRERSEPRGAKIRKKSKKFENFKNAPNGTKCIVNVPKCCFGAFSSIFERTSDTAAPAQPAPVVARPPQGRGRVKTQDYQNSKKIENFEHFPNAAKCIVNPAKRYFRPFWTIFAPFGPTTAELFFLANAVRLILFKAL